MINADQVSTSSSCSKRALGDTAFQNVLNKDVQGRKDPGVIAG